MASPRPRPRRPAASSRPAKKTRRRAARPLGAHQSIAGGLHLAVERAVETGCQCLQIFTRNINRWDVSPIDPGAAAAFRQAVATAGLSPVVAHDSYLINPASADGTLRRKSIAGLVIEIERADQLGIPWVVAHPGAAGDQPRDVAVARAAEGIAEASELGGRRPENLPEDMRYLGDRLRDAHDLWHVVTGYGPDLVGEGALLAFTFAQTKNPGILAVVLLGLAKFDSAGRADILAGYRAGQRADWLPAVEWEAWLARPLSEVRNELKVTQAHYQPVTSAELRSSGLLAAKPS